LLERLLFPDSTLLDGLPEIVAAQPWMRVRAKVFAYFQARALQRIEESMVVAGIDKLPEKLLDLLALDMLLWHYREDDPIETKRENIKNLFSIY